ncbi:cytidine deaminase-like protein [Martensiomyces pterosporus]|nr:cytidine deaminase-like protein [Martensiomyces pterosporus]
MGSRSDSAQRVERGTYTAITYDDGTREVETHVEFMRLAIQQAMLSEPIDTAFSVGALVVNGTHVLSEGHSRELRDPRCHASESAIKKAQASARFAYLVPGSTLYTTMEPCSSPGRPRHVPCTTHIINAGIRRVVIGVKEPTTFVDCHGVETLRQAGIDVVHLMVMQEECLAPNNHILV